MQGILTDEKENRSGQRLRRRTVIPVGGQSILIRRRRPKQTALPRSLRRCDVVLYPNGDPQNRRYALAPFRFFLPQILSRLERVYFPDRSICVALVTETLTPDARTALIQTLSFAGNCLVCTEDRAGESLMAELMDEYGLPSVATTQLHVLRQADVVLAFEDPNRWLRRCRSDALILNLSPTSVGVNYGRIVVEGVELKPLPELYDRLPADADWSAFCGLYLAELRENLRLKHPVYAKG